MKDFLDLYNNELVLQTMSPDNHLHPQAIDYDIEKEEKYEHTVVESKHLVYELKLGIILIIGGIIIVLCLFYILSQCKRKHMHSPRRQNNDQEKLIGSRDASEHLIHVHSTEKGKEYFL